MALSLRAVAHGCDDCRKAGISVDGFQNCRVRGWAIHQFTVVNDRHPSGVVAIHIHRHMFGRSRKQRRMRECQHLTHVMHCCTNEANVTIDVGATEKSQQASQ